MGKRRDIHLIDTRPEELAGAEYVLSVALHRDFARSPAYWVDLYCSQVTASRPAVWWALVQWQFTRQGEVVEGHSPPVSYLSHTQAAEAIESRADKKLDQGWLFHSLDVHSRYSKHAIVDYVGESVKKWSAKKEPKITTNKGPTFEELVNEPETRAERFARLQRERRAKAEW